MRMLGEVETRLELIAQSALARWRHALGRAPGSDVRFELSRAEVFQAEVVKYGDEVAVRVSQGAIDGIDRLWAIIWPVPHLRDEPWLLAQCAAERDMLDLVADLSIEWLLLHELTHVQLGHRSLLGRASLVEIGAEDVNPQSDAPAVIQLDDVLLPSELPYSRQCLEMQADSEAWDIFLGPFESADWSEIRVRAACTMVVVALIEREDARRGTKGLTHPMASSRFFMILAQLSQFWLYADARLSSAGETSRVRTAAAPDFGLFQRYLDEVFETLILYATVVAHKAGAVSMIADLKELDALSADLVESQNMDRLSDFVPRTAGARQWRDLLLINEKIMAAMGYRD